MNTAKSSLKEMAHNWGQMNEQQQKVVLGVVKTIVKEDPWWDDKEYIAEMDKRFDEMENGKVGVLDLDQMEKEARKSYKTTKRKKQ